MNLDLSLSEAFDIFWSDSNGWEWLSSLQQFRRGPATAQPLGTCLASSSHNSQGREPRSSFPSTSHLGVSPRQLYQHSPSSPSSMLSMPFFLQCSNASQSRSPIQMWQGLPSGPSMFCSDLQSQSMTQQLTSELYARHGIYGYLWIFMAQWIWYPCIMWWFVSVLPRSWDVWASLMQLDAIRTCMDFWHLSCWLKTAGPLRICSSDLSWDCTWRKEKKDSLSKNMNSTRLMEITENHSDLVSQRLSNMHVQQLAQFIAIFGIVQNQDMSSLAHFTFCTDNCRIYNITDNKSQA